jgi:hypothetical protein
MPRGRGDVVHAEVHLACRTLIEAGEVRTLNQLAEAVGFPFPRMRSWARKGFVEALKFGKTYYVSEKYALYFIDVWTRWETVKELSAKSGVKAGTIAYWANKQKVRAVRFANGGHRIDPQSFYEYLEKGRFVAEGVTVDDAVARIGCNPGTFACRVSQGVIVSVGEGANRRIPEEEVIRWEKWFKRLNAEFAWLEPVIIQPERQVETITLQQGRRILGVQQTTMATWSKDGLLPFFPGSFTAEGGSVMRLFVKRYILGLQRFVYGGKATRAKVIAYKACCEERGDIV